MNTGVQHFVAFGKYFPSDTALFESIIDEIFLVLYFASETSPFQISYFHSDMGKFSKEPFATLMKTFNCKLDLRLLQAVHMI